MRKGLDLKKIIYRRDSKNASYLCVQSRSRSTSHHLVDVELYVLDETERETENDYITGERAHGRRAEEMLSKTKKDERLVAV